MAFLQHEVIYFVDIMIKLPSETLLWPNRRKRYVSGDRSSLEILEAFAFECNQDNMFGTGLSLESKVKADEVYL